MVVIRLARKGRKKRPFYWIVVADSRSPRDGRIIEKIGYYDPLAKRSLEKISINAVRYLYWLNVGAKASDRVRRILKKFGSSINLKQMKKFLQKTGRYNLLLQRLLEQNHPESIIFELYFAYGLEKSGSKLIYERVANPNSEKTVDYAFEFHNDHFINFELVRPEQFEQINTARESQSEDHGRHGITLTTDHSNQYFQTGAQIIRVQEKLFEKLDKFPEPSSSEINVICIDCSNINFGMFDHEDCSNVMWGRAQNQFWTERFGENRVVGVMEEIHNSSDAQRLRESIHAVIFFPKLGETMLDDFFIAFNGKLDDELLEQGLRELQKLPFILNKGKVVLPPKN